ncbi:MAG: hypothetical protein BWY05_01347 [Euryarchaeota archaeon ADurb.Bin165]|nr:MAG: hypothetical protein BWY05_01347 [Euryarchaeota archaeon ADurb.Bin165]
MFKLRPISTKAGIAVTFVMSPSYKRPIRLISSCQLTRPVFRKVITTGYDWPGNIVSGMVSPTYDEPKPEYDIHCSWANTGDIKTGTTMRNKNKTGTIRPDSENEVCVQPIYTTGSALPDLIKISN